MLGCPFVESDEEILDVMWLSVHMAATALKLDYRIHMLKTLAQRHCRYQNAHIKLLETKAATREEKCTGAR